MLENKIFEIIKSALSAVDPLKIVAKNIHINNLELAIGGMFLKKKSIDSIHLIGFGKAAIPMGKGAIEQLGSNLAGGVLVAKHLNVDLGKFPNNLLIIKGDHPIPTQNSVHAAQEIVNYLSKVKENDLVITLISGGGSALVTLPKDPIQVGHINELTQSLLRSGASIYELNCVRKHIDLIKGGGLLKKISPARSISLVLSDVIGDDLSVIASGPTSPDTHTFQDAVDVLNKYHLWEKTDKSIKKILKAGLDGKQPETMKEGDLYLKRSTNKIVGSLSLAVDSAKQTAEDLGFFVEISDLALKGEARSVGKDLARKLIIRAKDVNLTEKPLCIIAGGETTVTVRGTGKGGRNQELALGAAIELDGTQGLTILTLATDGEDGPTDAAGAIIDSFTVTKALQLGLDPKKYLFENNSYNFFAQINCLIKTGPTGTNVNDLVFLFAGI